MRPANLTRAAPLSVGGPGKLVVALGDRGDALLRGPDHVPELALDACPVALDELLGVTAAALQLALEAGARLLDVALRVLAGGRATALELRDRDLGLRGEVADVADEGDRAVTGLERGADADERGALGDAAAVVGRALRGADLGLGGLAGLVGGDRAVALDGRLRRRRGRLGARRGRPLASGRRLARRGPRGGRALRRGRLGSWKWWWWCWSALPCGGSPSGAVQCIEVRTNKLRSFSSNTCL